MKNIRSKQIALLVLLFSAVVLVLPTFIRLNRERSLTKISAAYKYTNKQLNSVQVLESIDFNTTPARMRLHVQTRPSEGHDKANNHAQVVDINTFPVIPQRLLLIDKQNIKVRIELPLTYSRYPNECISHHHQHDTVIKWDSEWFTLEELTAIDNNYTSKLTDRYNVFIAYQEKGDPTVYSSLASVENVCYQATKIEPMPVTNFVDEGIPAE